MNRVNADYDSQSFQESLIFETEGKKSEGTSSSGRTITQIKSETKTEVPVLPTKPLDNKERLQQITLLKEELQKAHHPWAKKEFESLLGDIVDFYYLHGKSPFDEDVDTVKKTSQVFEDSEISQSESELENIFSGKNVDEGFEEFNQPAIKIKDEYKKFTVLFKDSDGNDIGEARVNRLNVRDSRIDSLNNKIAFLNNKENLTEKDVIELKKCEKELELFKNLEEEWFASEYSREAARENREILPGPPNARVYSVKDSQNKDLGTFIGCGTIWDARNGLTNLSNLRAIEKNLHKIQEKARNGENIDSDCVKFNKNLDKKIAELVALKGKFTKPDEIELIDNTIKDLYSMRINIDKLDLHKQLESAQELKADRQRYLREQTTELLKTHLKENFSRMKIIDGVPTFPLMRLSFLNENAGVDFRDGGWVHIEKKQILDHSSIIEALDGCEIKVVEHGNFFIEDNDGKLTYYISREELPQDANVKIGDSITLKTFFMNVRVQGQGLNPFKQEKNEGLQRTLNNEGIDKLLDFAESVINNGLPEEERKKWEKSLEDLYNIKSRLMQGNESSYALAEEISVVAMQIVSLEKGCFQDKDRGGTISTLICNRLILDNLRGKRTPEQLKKDKELLRSKIYDKAGICRSVIRDCTGASLAKVNYLLVPHMPFYEGLQKAITMAWKVVVTKEVK